MLQKKICMLGGFSVGKTSLVRRFVQSIFSETYLTTVGVKIDKKSVVLSDKTVDLILWDLAGEDDIGSFRLSYVRGASGLVLVSSVEGQGDQALSARNPFDIAPLMLFAVLFGLIATTSAALVDQFGSGSLVAASAVSGIVDVDVATLTALRMVKQAMPDQITAPG